MFSNEFGLTEGMHVATSCFGYGVEMGMSVAKPRFEMERRDTVAGGSVGRRIRLVGFLLPASSAVCNEAVLCHFVVLFSVVLYVDFSVAKASVLLLLLLV